MGATFVSAPACSTADPVTDAGGDSATDDGGQDGGGPEGDQVGLFKVSLIAPVAASSGVPAVAGYTSLFGKVYTGPLPSLLIWNEAAREGDCKLLTPQVPVCNPACDDTAACVGTNRCQPYPTVVNAGTITLKGLSCSNGGDLSIAAVSNNYQIPGNVTCPFPAFAESDEIGITASGGQYGPFTLQAAGIAPLEILNDTISLAPGQPVALSWAPPSGSGSHIHVKLDISHHGGVRGMIECDTVDDGSLQISASLLDGLRALGVSGFPTIVVSRATSGSAQVSAGHIDLNVLSEIEKAVEIPGLVSCTDTSECPAGLTCQADLQCK